MDKLTKDEKLCLLLTMMGYYYAGLLIGSLQLSFWMWIVVVAAIGVILPWICVPLSVLIGCFVFK